MNARDHIEIEAVQAGRMSGRETALLLYGALDALCGLLLPVHAAGGRRVLEAAAHSLWPWPDGPLEADDQAAQGAES